MEKSKYGLSSNRNVTEIIKNDQPMSLLHICSKIIFNCLSKYLKDYKLLNCNQSSFWPGDSCVHQLLLITYEIYKSFDVNHLPEVRGVFLDIYKAFGRVWHDNLFFFEFVVGTTI